MTMQSRESVVKFIRFVLMAAALQWFSSEQAYSQDIDQRYTCENDRKVGVMAGFLRPKTAEEMLSQIATTETFFPQRLKRDEYDIESLTARTATVLSNLVDNFTSHEELRTQVVASELTKLITKFNTAVARATIKNYSMRYPADQVASQIVIGETAKDYAARADRNGRNITMNNLQQLIVVNVHTWKQTTKDMLRCLQANRNLVDTVAQDKLLMSIRRM